MADSDPRPPPGAAAGGGVQPPPAEAKSVPGGLGQIADFLSKVGSVAIAAAVGITGYHLQRSATESQLLNQREQAETSVRAEMFKTVAEKVTKTKSEITWAEKAVFAEILALNFHQHIELKPLLLDIERQLVRECGKQQDEMSKAAARAAKTLDAASSPPLPTAVAVPCDPTDLAELRSVATRVKSRQLQIIADAFSSAAREGTKNRPGIVDAVPATVQYIALQEDGPRPVGNVAGVTSNCAAPVDEGGINACILDPLTFALPDRKSTLTIAVRKVDFKRARASLSVGYRKQCTGENECPAPASAAPADASKPAAAPQPGSLGQCGAFVSDADLELSKKTGNPITATKGPAPAPASDIRALNDFETTWFDFPLTDNSLLYNKTRYAVVIDRVCPDDKVIRLGLVWFPQNFAPAYERPITHSELMSRLGLK